MDQPVIVIDLRCLQEPQYAERGIPSHARNVISRARDVSSFARNAKIIGIIDPNLDEVERLITDSVDELRPNAYLPELKPGSVFLNPSPMTQDQIYISRLLLNPEIYKAVIVYDFIPYDDPGYYMKHFATRLDFLSSYAWLKRYDVFLPISKHTQTRLHEIYTLGDQQSFVTGVHIAPWLENMKSSLLAPRHILAVTGDHPRKNAEILIKAHAKSAVLQSHRIPLVIVGNYLAWQEQKFRVNYQQYGGDPALLEIPGRVSNETLLGLYQQAICVVTPSRAEGFSMPVVEAMAAGVPSIASDIPVHAALVNNPSLRFHPDDDAALTVLLERILLDTGFRNAIIAEQAETWPPFKAKIVAKAVWDGIETSLAARMPPSFAIARQRPRVAMLTPLPPARSGVADYSAACVQSLKKLVDLSLFSLEPNAGAKPLSAIPHLSNRFDLVISVLGNSSFHDQIFDLHIRYGSACICHDSRLLHFFVSRFGIAKAAQIASKELGRKVTEDDIRRWQRDETGREALSFGDLAKSAQPIIFHSQKAALCFQNRYGVKPHYLPFAIYRPGALNAQTRTLKKDQRNVLGFSDSAFLIISLGFVSATKGLGAAIQAMVHLNDFGVQATLVWVGEAECDLATWRAQARALGVGSNVIFLNQFVDEATYCVYLQAADCALQLRVGGNGNISGALQDCIAAGLPTVANDDLAESLNAPSYVIRVKDNLDPVEIAAALASIKNNRPDTSAERNDHAAAHSMDIYARNLCNILEIEV